MITGPPITDNVALYVVGVLALLLISVLGLVIRAIVKGDLLPKGTVDRWLVELDQRIAAQAKALDAASELTIEQGHTIRAQADSISDFGEAQRLQVRVAAALHQVTEAGDV
ncbi:hypothetical protein EF294_15790 [Gordonia oryzae]|uniref:Uncharacterized protein n=1 Tax=Gordonia oryzae TaxID=2487349 RepID=A0A3N4GB58_9ACTN|nr:hypothetical protein [Gordonia oryzae]RPA58617.1 hypothetical protein EF294_15790 [Gordonia oryzae]